MHEIEDHFIEIAPCLKNNPLSDSGRQLLLELKALGTSPMATILRTWAGMKIYNDMEKILGSSVDPTSQMIASFLQTIEVAKSMQEIVEKLGHLNFLNNDEKQENLTDYDHFGNLFSNNISQQFWEQPFQQLTTRLKINQISLEMFEGANVIDIGCGSGRNTFVLNKLGAKNVVGVDVSQAGIELAMSRQKELGLTKGVEFLHGSALDLPFEDGSFDIAFSMGVFHHVADWQSCFNEMYRVIKPGGQGLLMYLNEKPGGLFYDVIEVLRCIAFMDNHAIVQLAFESIAVSPGTIIKHLDPLLCEVNVRLTKSDIEAQLETLGAKHVTRLVRGFSTDRCEKIYSNAPFAKEKYGIGENRYIFTKSE